MQHGEDCLAGAEEEHAAEMGEGARERCPPVRYTLCVCVYFQEYGGSDREG